MNDSFQNRRVLLQHGRTGLFFVRDADWTSDPLGARDFVTTQAAVLYSQARELAGARPVMHFLPPAFHSPALPVSAENPPQPCAVG